MSVREQQPQLDPQLVLNTIHTSEPRTFAYLDVIKAIVQDMVHFQSLQPLLAYVVSSVQQRLDFYITSIFWYDQENEVALLVAQAGKSDEPAPIGYIQSTHEGVLGRALRSGTSLLVNDVEQTADYVSPEGYAPARSELCVPIQAHGITWGAINVESTESGAFTYYDQLALELIATQLGSAIYTMDLLKEQQRMLEELSQHSERQDRLLDQIFRLSTPVFPVYPGILALPMVGKLDNERMQKTVTSLLESVQQTKSNSIILDLTGVGGVDNFAAQALISLIKSSKLLGAEVVVTGIRPDVAQTLIGLQAELGNVVVRSNFADGLQYALHRSGKGIVQRSATRQPLVA